MILGIPLPVLIALHVVISLIGIASGIIVLVGMFGSHLLPRWTALFLITTALTSITGFLFPNHGITPAQIFGYLSLVIIAITLLALYVFQLFGAARWIYATGAVIALYLNVFVAVVKAFAKIPFLHSLAPTQSEAPFVVTELVVLVLVLVLGVAALAKFHPQNQLRWHRQSSSGAASETFKSPS
jgi:hypothetical protein